MKTDLDHRELDEIRKKRPSKYRGLNQDEISLGLAESDFEMPVEVKQAMIDAIMNGEYHYQFDGLPGFLEAAKEKLWRFNNLRVGEDEIMPIAGGMNGIWLASRCLVRPGEKVIAITPNYPPIIEMPRTVSQAEVVETMARGNFHMDLEAIEAAITERTRMISICNPNNPSGAVYSREELGGLAELATRHDLYAFSDELYENLTYDGRRHLSLASLPGMKERTVTVFAFTKIYGMSGLRIGYLVGPKEIVKGMKEENSRVFIQPSTIDQIAGSVALAKCDYYVESLKAHLEKVRNHITGKLNEVPMINMSPPEGAFFAFPDLSPLFQDDENAVVYIRQKAKIQVSGGKGFGKGGERHIRISFCSPWEIVTEATARICRALWARASSITSHEESSPKA